MELLQTVLDDLKSHANPANVEGMARFGIRSQNTVYGISVPILREMAKPLRKNHALAQGLWESGVHEARLLACLVEDPKQVTEAQAETWAASFDTWDICDQCCLNVLSKTPFAYAKAHEWSAREAEFVKRAGFVLMATLAVHNKKAGDDAFLPFLPIIEREAHDERNFVKKAVNWALRQIGKRNRSLNARAIESAHRIEAQDSKAARWVAKNALRELTSDAAQKRLK